MYRLSLWDSTRAHETNNGISEVKVDCSEEEAIEQLLTTVDSGKATFGQVLTENGLILKNYARPVN